MNKMRNAGIGAMLIGTLFIAGSCDMGSKELVTQSGLRYTILMEGSEEIPPGDMLLVNFVAMDQSDSIWLDSRPQGMPRPARKIDSVSVINQGGIEEVLFYMKKGDSVTCQIPVEKIYGQRNIPPGVEEGTLLKVNMVIEDAMDEEAFHAYREEMMKKQRLINEEKGKEQLAADIEIIDNYLSENGIEAIKTESGLRYVITQQGEGENVKSGQQVRVNYAGNVLNGPLFDTSIEEVAKENGVYDERRTYEPYLTPIGVGQVIKGWDEAFQLLNEGSKATLYIPSGLAYGPRARSKEIVPNSILVFEVELVEIIDN